MELLSSGPQRPPEPEPRPWTARGRRAWRRRGVRTVTVALVAVLTLLLLRVTVDRPAVRRPVAVTPTPPPPPPSFDRLPGRTLIPDPAQTGDLLSGPLPSIGPPTAAVARQAVGLVLGRYCADLDRFSVKLQPDSDGAAADYHHLAAFVTDVLYTDSRPGMRLSLDYDGRAYRWLGPLTLLQGC